MSPFQDAYIERINKGEETYSAEGLAAIVREIFIIGAESESVLMRWKCENLLWVLFGSEVIQNGCAQTCYFDQPRPSNNQLTRKD